jgi:hypothetical protein
VNSVHRAHRAVPPVFVIAALFLAAPIKVFAHGDEDHGAPVPVVGLSAAPRATARSEEFEAVAVLEGKKLVLYLDRFASNAPVIGAKVDIEGDGLKGVATETLPGVYVMDAVSLAPAQQSLTISIEAGDSADLLLATLDAAPAPTGEAHVHSGREWRLWVMGGVLGMLGMFGGSAATLWAIRRRTPSKGVERCAN